jgi:hypothetical protein
MGDPTRPLEPLYLRHSKLKAKGGHFRNLEVGFGRNGRKLHTHTLTIPIGSEELQDFTIDYESCLETDLTPKLKDFYGEDPAFNPIEPPSPPCVKINLCHSTLVITKVFTCTLQLSNQPGYWTETRKDYLEVCRHRSIEDYMQNRRRFLPLPIAAPRHGGFLNHILTDADRHQNLTERRFVSPEGDVDVEN